MRQRQDNKKDWNCSIFLLWLLTVWVRMEEARKSWSSSSGIGAVSGWQYHSTPDTARCPHGSRNGLPDPCNTWKRRKKRSVLMKSSLCHFVRCTFLFTRHGGLCWVLRCWRRAHSRGYPVSRSGGIWCPLPSSWPSHPCSLGNKTEIRNRRGFFQMASSFPSSPGMSS